MALHSNKEDEQRKERRLVRLVNTGRYGCGVCVDRCDFGRRKRIGFCSTEKESDKEATEVKMRDERTR